MKIRSLLIALCLLSFLRPLRADTSLDLPGLGTINLSNLVANTGGMFAYDNHGTKWGGVTVRVGWLPADPETAWIGLEGAVLWDTRTGAPSGLAGWLGFRADTLGGKLLCHLPQLGHLTIPAIEFGPMGGYLTAQKEWIYGLGVAKHF